MNLNDIIIFLSLATTPVTIIMCIAVCAVWRKSAIDAIIHKPKSDLDWFIVGVFIGFLGSTLDNIYWGIAWSLNFTNSSYKEWVFNHGAWSNLPFRQITTTVAAICHLMAATHTNRILLKWLAWVSAVVSFIFLIGLMMVK